MVVLVSVEEDRGEAGSELGGEGWEVSGGGEEKGVFAVVMGDWLVPAQVLGLDSFFGGLGVIAG